MAPCRLARLRSAPARFALLRLAPPRSAPASVAPASCASWKFAPFRSAPDRSTPARSRRLKLTPARLHFWQARLRPARKSSRGSACAMPDKDPAARHAAAMKPATLKRICAGCTREPSLPAQRDLDPAGHPARRHLQLDLAAELVRDEVADQAGAVAGAVRRRDRRAAGLAPRHQEARRAVGAGH